MGDDLLSSAVMLKLNDFTADHEVNGLLD